MKDIPRWLKILAVLIPVIGGLTALGIISPGWASKEDLKKVEEEAETCCIQMQLNQAEINGQLEEILRRLPE